MRTDRNLRCTATSFFRIFLDIVTILTNFAKTCVRGVAYRAGGVNRLLPLPLTIMPYHSGTPGSDCAMPRFLQRLPLDSQLQSLALSILHARQALE
jgi:hypothetical protein